MKDFTSPSIIRALSLPIDEVPLNAINISIVIANYFGLFRPLVDFQYIIVGSKE